MHALRLAVESGMRVIIQMLSPSTHLPSKALRSIEHSRRDSTATAGKARGAAQHQRHPRLGDKLIVGIQLSEAVLQRRDW
jgi:hypothetical protein